ncbi:MAG: hypothetical protein IJY12_03920 [Clostridia bacterium]|nr:hypothetical protein [Clostridia bacterium]
MTVKELVERLELSVLSMPEPEAEVSGAYAGDLLSWVMGRATEGNAWVTIMTNVNTVAVASLTGVALVIICDSGEIEDEVVKTASQKSVNMARTSLPMYEMCVKLSEYV